MPSLIWRASASCQRPQLDCLCTVGRFARGAPQEPLSRGQQKKPAFKPATGKEGARAEKRQEGPLPATSSDVPGREGQGKGVCVAVAKLALTTESSRRRATDRQLFRMCCPCWLVGEGARELGHSGCHDLERSRAFPESLGLEARLISYDSLHRWASCGRREASQERRRVLHARPLSR